MLLRRCISVSHRNFYSTLAATEQNQKLVDFRTLENDPSKHRQEHISRFYQIPDNVKKQLFSQGGFPKEFERQVKTFAESCLMIRQPAVEVINYIQASVNPSNPVVRYVLYGKNGVGKSLSLSHVLHFGMTAGFILVHVPYAPYWFKWPKEYGASATKEGLTDLPLDAAAWLINFKAQNSQLLTNPELITSREYVWSKRETTPAGAKLLDLIEHGINRVKFASDVMDSLIEELKVLSTAGKCKTLVVIDGYNAFWWPLTRLHGQYKVKIKTDDVTVTKPFKSITNYDWTNGAVVLTVDTMAIPEQYESSPLPRLLLGEKGFEHLDPFVPIEVTNYDKKEFQNCIEYYLDRKWIQNTKPGFRDELEYLSNRNPFELMRICAPL